MLSGEMLLSDKLLDRLEYEGATARLRDDPRTSNPYTNEELAFVWDLGWLEGEHSEARDRLRA